MMSSVHWWRQERMHKMCSGVAHYVQKLCAQRPLGVEASAFCIHISVCCGVSTSHEESADAQL